MTLVISTLIKRFYVKVFFGLFILNTSIATFAQFVPDQCIQIYFDRSPQPTYTIGYSQALLMSNLIRHYTNSRVSILPIESYSQGNLLRCHYNIYLGTFYNNFLPPAFINEALSLSTSLVWMGYNIWQLGFLFGQYFNYDFIGLAKLDPIVRDSWGAPSFFSEIHYHNDTFIKYLPGRPDSSFHAPFEMAALRVRNGIANRPIAIATNPWRNESLPYLIGQSNKFYFADSPLSFMHESNHHLILSDFLKYFIGKQNFENSNVSTVSAPRMGLILTTPDVETMSNQLYTLTQELIKEGIPYYLAFYPSKDDKAQDISKSEGWKRKILREAEGVFWDLRVLSQSSLKGIPLQLNEAKEIIKLALSTQKYFLSHDFKPLAVLDTISDRSLLANSVLAQLFPIKIGSSEVYNFVSLDFLNSPDLPLRNWFPLDENKANSLNLNTPQVFDGFHQTQVTPFLIQKDLMNQLVLPLRFNLVNKIDLTRVLSYTKALGTVVDSAHFISIDSSFLKTSEDREQLLLLLKDYKMSGYKFIFQKNLNQLIR